MKLYCEFVVGEILPSLRVMITHELTNQYHMTQKKIAEKLGLTQPAISQYRKNIRGFKVEELQKNKKVDMLIKELTHDIALGNISPDETATKILQLSHMIVDKKIIAQEDLIQKKIPCTICFKP